MTLRIEAREGKRGKWRWFAYEGQTFRFSGRITGHSTKEKALKRAKKVLEAAVEIEGEYGPEYAGPREFSD